MTAPTSDQTVDRVLDGLLDACRTIFATVHDDAIDEYTATWNDGAEDRTLVVVDVAPGTYQPDVVIAVGTDVQQPIVRPTMGPDRSREVSPTIDIVVSVMLPGGSSAATAARHCAMRAAELIALYFRTPGNETLGGACREAWVSAIKGPDVNVVGTKEGGTWGRMADVTLTVTAKVRN